MMQTLDQQRAEFAWNRAKYGAEKSKAPKTYVAMTKGASAFIMSNGLMQALAYYQSRTGSNKEAAGLLLNDMLEWLRASKALRVSQDSPRSSDLFNQVMTGLFKSSATEYMRATQETLAMLRWLRQFADALKA